ncbi:hypothetical protein VTK56DRAFT_10273 [Thermocarpiscus australiensis]
MPDRTDNVSFAWLFLRFTFNLHLSHGPLEAIKPATRYCCIDSPIRTLESVIVCTYLSLLLLTLTLSEWAAAKA